MTTLSSARTPITHEAIELRPQLLGARDRQRLEGSGRQPISVRHLPLAPVHGFEEAGVGESAEEMLGVLAAAERVDLLEDTSSRHPTQTRTVSASLESAAGAPVADQPPASM